MKISELNLSECAQEVLRTALNGARVNFETFGHCVPVAILSNGGPLSVVTFTFKNVEEKAAAFAWVHRARQVCGEEGAIALVSEMWYAKTDPESFYGGDQRPPSEREDRKEALNVILWQGQRAVNIMAQIVRAEGIVLLNDWELANDTADSKAGVMAGDMQGRLYGNEEGQRFDIVYFDI